MNLNLGDTRLIIAEGARQGLLRNQLAYVLATAKWETAHTMKPIREMGGEAYLRGKKYYPYVGMGYVQLTWRENYQKATNYFKTVLGIDVDFVKNPNLLLVPDYAKVILVTGMKEGWFTGRKLSDYITLTKSNFESARQIVNALDRFQEIADIAREYDRTLLAEGYGVTQPEPPIVVPEPPVVEPEPIPEPEPVDQLTIDDYLAVIDECLMNIRRILDGK